MSLKLRHILENMLLEISLEFKDENTGYSHGQSDNSLYAYNNGNEVGRLDYSEYEGSPAIKMLEVPKQYQRQGIGTALLKQLQKMNNGKEIDLGMLTDDGAALLKTVNRVFIPNKTFEKLKIKLDKSNDEKERIMKDVNSGNRQEIHKLNDLHDEIYELEDLIRETEKGKWIIK